MRFLNNFWNPISVILSNFQKCNGHIGHDLQNSSFKTAKKNLESIPCRFFDSFAVLVERARPLLVKDSKREDAVDLLQEASLEVDHDL